MSLPEEFDESRKIITDSGPSFDFEAFKAFVSEHGEEKAHGYILALIDMYKKIDWALTQPTGGKYVIPDTAAHVRKKTDKMHIELGEFLTLVEGLPWKDSKNSSPTNDANKKQFPS